MTVFEKQCKAGIDGSDEPLLLQAREARTDIVEQQCIAEIKRNTGKVVLSDGFLNLPEDLILELTSWNGLRVSEVDLYQAIKKLETTVHYSNESLILPSREGDF